MVQNFVKNAMHEAGVAIVPGTAFGQTSNRLREVQFCGLTRTTYRKSPWKK